MMGQKSSIDRLPDDLRKKLIELLNDPAVTQAEIVDLINTEAGEDLLSKSSLNRYAQKMKRFSEKNRQAKEVADAYLDKFGAEGRNKLGKVVNEQIRLIAFDLVTDLDDLKESGKSDPQLITDVIFKVSRGLKDLEQAEKLNADREQEIRTRVLAEAVEKVDSIGRRDGISTETMAEIRKELLGLNDG
jgi:Protein of unknown function (DUF3486).